MPIEPLSIFGTTSLSLFTQTAPQTPREPEKRNVTAEAWAEHQQAVFVDKDVIYNFEGLENHCFDKFYSKLFVTLSNGSLKICKLDDECPPDLKYSLIIHDDFKVDAYRGRKKIVTRDIISGFTNQLTRYSHSA